MNQKTISQLREAIKNVSACSAWSKGIKLYALELIEEMPADQEFYASPADKKNWRKRWVTTGNSTARGDVLNL